MSVKADVGGMTSETRVVHERSEATANRMVAEDITVAATGITSAMIEAHKAAVKEEMTEAAVMTGTMVVRKITEMAVIRMATGTVVAVKMAEETATARMETVRTGIGMVTGTVAADRTATARTEIARMTTRMVEGTVHRMAGIIVEETNIPRPTLVNIAALAQEGTEPSSPLNHSSSEISHSSTSSTQAFRFSSRRSNILEITVSLMIISRNSCR